MTVEREKNWFAFDIVLQIRANKKQNTGFLVTEKMSYHSEHGMQLFARLDSITIKKEVSTKHVKSLIYKFYDGLKREKNKDMSRIMSWEDWKIIILGCDNGWCGDLLVWQQTK